MQMVDMLDMIAEDADGYYLTFKHLLNKKNQAMIEDRKFYEDSIRKISKCFKQFQESSKKDEEKLKRKLENLKRKLENAELENAELKEELYLMH